MSATNRSKEMACLQEVQERSLEMAHQFEKSFVKERPNLAHFDFASRKAGVHTSGVADCYEHDIVQGISFLGPAACLLGCAAITPYGAKHAAGILSSQATGVIVGLLSVSFALGAWARGGLYCNHQVSLTPFACPS